MKIASGTAERLLQINAIKLSPQNPFTWASGILSPIYCDNRIILSYPAIRRFIIQNMVVRSKEFDGFTAIAGVATAGIAHGALLANELDLPFAYVRSKAKAHGRQNLIEGELPKDAKVLVVEDLISTGGSSMKAVEALRENGHNVIGVLAIFSYGLQSAIDVFEKGNCPFKTLSNYDVLLERALETKYIEQNDLQTLKEWKKNPTNWGKNQLIK